MYSFGSTPAPIKTISVSEISSSFLVVKKLTVNIFSNALKLLLNIFFNTGIELIILNSAPWTIMYCFFPSCSSWLTNKNCGLLEACKISSIFFWLTISFISRTNLFPAKIKLYLDLITLSPSAQLGAYIKVSKSKFLVKDSIYVEIPPFFGE